MKVITLERGIGNKGLEKKNGSVFFVSNRRNANLSKEDLLRSRDIAIKEKENGLLIDL